MNKFYKEMVNTYLFGFFILILIGCLILVPILIYFDELQVNSLVIIPALVALAEYFGITVKIVPLNSDLTPDLEAFKKVR